ncbi:hypothetical protein D6817_05440 [Candidatus Pacearchaeota archaeon]|nr:MAG: hypothetical protein D6817_05440 [Candidatus Pacearchaeota archaeon]
MVVDLKKILAAVSPSVYCDASPDETGVKLSDKVAKIVRTQGYVEAAKVAKLISPTYLDVSETLEMESPFSLKGLKSPLEMHSLEYDAPSQSLESVYFWLLDYATREYDDVEKIVDNFVSSAGSGHFSELGKRATAMQEEAMKIFGTINTIIKSIINIIYELKELRSRLELYDDLRSKDKNTRDGARLALKQLWMDSVDIKRGNTAIKLMAQQFEYVTLIDAFMGIDKAEDVDKADLNERVKRIVKQRLTEFEIWVKESEKELRKRYEIEKIYLKSQVNSIKLYARWVKPYLKAAQQLEQRAAETADLVSVFNTTLFELALLAKKEYDVKRDVESGNLPKVFLKAKARKYYEVAIIELKFRSIPERIDARGGYGYRGRVKVEFIGCGLNEDELEAFKQAVDEDNLEDAYKVIAGATEESLEHLKTDIDELLGEVEQKKEEKKEENEDINPFSALFSLFKPAKKEPEERDISKGIEKDNDYEKVIRSQAILNARRRCADMYSSFKKSLGLVTA